MDVKGSVHSNACPAHFLSRRQWVSTTAHQLQKLHRRGQINERALCPSLCRAAKAGSSVLAGERAQEQASAVPEQGPSTSDGNGALYAEARTAQVRSRIVDESTEDRAPFHRELQAAAKDGRAEDAESILRGMEAEGMQPGPLAYHALICAYCKAQDSQGALSATRRAAQEGLQPIAETYCAIMHALMLDGDKDAAFRVFQSMLAAGVDARKGWLLLCKDWFRFGFFEDAYALVQKGRLDGWYPDADLYELLIAWMCTQEDLVDTAEQLVRQELLEAGIVPEARHANPLVMAEAVNVSVHTAMGGPLKEMQEGRLGVGCRPTADTYNAITQGCIVAIQRRDGSGGSAVYEVLQEIKGAMIQAGLKFNKRTHALFVEAHLLESNAEFAMLAFEDMAKLARPGAVVDCLSDAALTTLLTTLALVNRPADLLRVLRAMQGDGRPVPLEAVTPLGTAGACFLTSWLPAALDSAKTMRQVQGLTKEAEVAEDGEYREIEGVLIGPGGFAVAEDGTVLSVSKLTLPALRAELIARGLSVEGKRRDLYRRVQAARASVPRDVADEVRSQEKRALAKEVREDASVKAKVAKARERRVVAWQVERWKDGKLVSTTQELETEEEADGDEEIDWEEDEPATRKPKAGKEKGTGELDTDEDLEKLRERFAAVAVEDSRPWWPQEWEPGELALEMVLIAESLGCMGTLGDWAMLAKAAVQENNEDISNAVTERLPYLAQFAAEQGDERLSEIMQQAMTTTDAENLELLANALLL